MGDWGYPREPAGWRGGAAPSSRVQRPRPIRVKLAAAWELSTSPGLLEFEVTVPCIVNTAKIAGGAEIVLKWEKKVEAKETDGKKKVINALTAGAPKNVKR